MYFQRNIESKLLVHVKRKEIVVLTGMRRTGKTTLLKRIFDRIKSRNKVFLDLENTLEQRIFEEIDYNNILENLKSYGITIRSKIYLFIDEIHTVIGAGATSGGAMDASNLLKPALARGELHCVGATTLDEYRKYIEKDAALARRFQSIPVDPPNNEQAIEILKGLRERYETHHRVKITDAAVRAAVELSGRYITGRVQPDKAIDVIDEAGARVRIMSMTKPPDLADIEADIERLSIEKDEAVKAADYERAAELRDKAEKMRKKKEDIQSEWRTKSMEVDGIVDEEVVAEVVSKMTGVPLQRLEQGHPPRTGRAQGSQAAHGFVYLCRAFGRGQDAALQGTR